MSTAAYSIEKQVKAFCAQIGADPLLVQGAGGNVSWKNGDVLWVKASGTWLAEAESKNIFVPVDLVHLQDALGKQDFFVKPMVNNNSGLRPSIETLLHALMPHRVVVHLHAVEILAYLVQVNARQKIKSLVADSVKWIYIDYFKPGAELASAVSEKLSKRPDADVVFLENHGVVIGGNDAEEIDCILNKLVANLTNEITIPNATRGKRIAAMPELKNYVLIDMPHLHDLARLPALYSRLKEDWALYPDHVVFLGPRSYCYAPATDLSVDSNNPNAPDLVFIEGLGVYVRPDFSLAKKLQLQCFYDVMIRQPETQRLNILSNDQITELLSWDAERYRRNMMLHQASNFS